jgi:hypothetical protein
MRVGSRDSVIEAMGNGSATAPGFAHENEANSYELQLPDNLGSRPVVAELIAGAGCGLSADRGILAIYARSIVRMHALGERIVAERERFRRKPDHWRTPTDWKGCSKNQLHLPFDSG